MTKRLAFLIICAMIAAGPVCADDWSAWNNYKALHVRSNTTSTTAGYVASADISDIVNSSKSDKGDIRVAFYDAVGEEWNEIDRQIFGHWALFKTQRDIAANGDDTYYRIYYNNPQASSPANTLSNIYPVSDDFSGESLDTDLWKASSTGGSITVSDGKAVLTADNSSGSKNILLITGRAIPPFTEVDSAGKLTVSSNTVSASSLCRPDRSYVYADMGDGSIGDYTLKFTANMSSSTDYYGLIRVGFTNELEQTPYVTTGISVQYHATKGHMIGFSSNTGDHVNINAGPTYYCTLERSGSSTTLYVYTNSTRTTLLGSVTKSTKDTPYRYLRVGSDLLDDGNCYSFTGTIGSIVLADFASAGTYGLVRGDITLPDTASDNPTCKIGVSSTASGYTTSIGIRPNSSTVTVNGSSYTAPVTFQPNTTYSVEYSTFLSSSIVKVFNQDGTLLFSKITARSDTGPFYMFAGLSSPSSTGPYTAYFDNLCQTVRKCPEVMNFYGEVTTLNEQAYPGMDNTVYFFEDGSAILKKSTDLMETASVVYDFSAESTTGAVYIASNGYIYCGFRRVSGSGGVVYRSTDNGTSFNIVLTFDSVENWQPCIFQSWSVTEAADGTLFIGTYANGTNDNIFDPKLYRSTDNGATWSTIYTFSNYRHIHKVLYCNHTEVLYVTTGENKHIFKCTNPTAASPSFVQIGTTIGGWIGGEQKANTIFWPTDYSNNNSIIKHVNWIWGAPQWTKTDGSDYTYETELNQAFNATSYAYENTTALTARASVALVDANAGSYYASGSKLYVHLSDHSAPADREVHADYIEENLDLVGNYDLMGFNLIYNPLNQYIYLALHMDAPYGANRVQCFMGTADEGDTWEVLEEVSYGAISGVPVLRMYMNWSAESNYIYAKYVCPSSEFTYGKRVLSANIVNTGQIIPVMISR